ncbi:MAG TPA: hypothetical protein VFP28_09960 [Gemmatimonadales bacterium]|nr:hypothetical protein [Gemmatimonadales bacterium]
MLVPKIITTLRGYDRTQFMADLGAGVIVGIVALPLVQRYGVDGLRVATLMGGVMLVGFGSWPASSRCCRPWCRTA